MVVCEFCSDKTWVHSVAPFEVEACLCNRGSEIDDLLARKKHKEDHPDCQWPDHDLHYEFLHNIRHLEEDEELPSQFRPLVTELIELTEKRLSFPTAWGTAMLKLGELYDGCCESEAAIETTIWGPLNTAAACLTRCLARMRSGKWTLAHALTPADGDLSPDGQWKVRPLELDRTE